MPEVLHYSIWKDFTQQSPAVRAQTITLFDTQYTLAPMNDNELSIFNAQFPTLFGVPDSEERLIMSARVNIFMYGLRAIKYKLDNPAFKGLNPADNELGFGSIRPQFTCTALAGYKTNWNQVLVANTWTDYFFTGADTGYQIGRDFGLIVTHLASYVSPTPFVSEVHNVIGRTDIIPTDVRPIKLADNNNGIAYYPLPSMFMMPRDTWWLEIMADNAGTEILQPGGLVVGFGRVLKETAPTWTP